MAQTVRVSWFHTEEFQAEFEVEDDFNPEEDEEELLEQIVNMDHDELTEAFEGCTDREITEVTPVE